MIPYSIFAARISGAGFSAPEVRALSLEQNRFTFRLSHRVEQEKVLRADSLEVAFFSWEKQDYEKLALNAGEFVIEVLPEESEFYSSYRLTTESEEFSRLASRLLFEYSRYIRLKLEGDEAALTEELVGGLSAGPSEEDECSEGLGAPDLASHVRRLGENVRLSTNADFPNIASFGLRLDRPDLIRRFLATPSPCEKSLHSDFVSEQSHAGMKSLHSDFVFEQSHAGLKALYSELLSEQGLAGHPISSLSPSVLYVGNEYCAELFPEADMERIFRKAAEENLSLVWMFAPMRERDVDRYERILRKLGALYLQSTGTLVLNDLGAINLAHEIFAGRPVKLLLGSLLHKRRKDPRMQYRAGGRNSLLAGSGLLDPAFRRYLYGLGISGFTAETVGYDQVLPENTEALFFPWYQTNTAGLCTLAALVERGDRGSQRLEAAGACPMHCERTACIYPELPELIGRGNSLFAFDERSLADPEYLNRLLAQGVGTPVFCPM